MTFTTPAVTSRTSLERFSGRLESFQNHKPEKENLQCFIYKSWYKYRMIFSLYCLLVSFAPKLKIPSTAISTHQTPTCYGILCSWWKPLRTLQLITLTTLWWARFSMTAQPTVTALCVMCLWMCVWTTETLRGGLLFCFVTCVWLFAAVLYSLSGCRFMSCIVLLGWTISGFCAQSWQRIVAPWVPSGLASSRLCAVPLTTATAASMICCAT